MEPQTTASAPRYGAATLANTTTTTTATTTTGIKWGGVIKGVAVVGAVVLAGVGAYYGATWLFGGPETSVFLAKIQAQLSALTFGDGGLIDFITKTIPAWFTGDVIPFLKGPVLTTIGDGIAYVFSGFSNLLSWAGIISPQAAANVDLVGSLSPSFMSGSLASSATHNVAAAAGIGAVALATPTMIHSLANTQIIEHAVAEHVTHHAAEHAERVTEKKWTDGRIAPRSAAAPIAPRESSFTAQVDKDTAALNAALKTPAV